MESWDALNRICGKKCLITLIEEPVNENNSKFWQALNLSEENSRLNYEQLLDEKPDEQHGKINSQLLSYKPFSKDIVTRTAEQLHIPATEIPCLVFYANTNLKGYLVYSFANDWSPEQLSGHIKKIFASVKKHTETEWFTHLPKEIRRKKILINLESDFGKIKGSKFVKRIMNTASIGNIIKDTYVDA